MRLLFANNWFENIKSNAKLSADVAYNVAGFIVSSASAVAFNIIIARIYGAAALGVFNLVYATYILFSQVAAAGIHLSVAKYAAEFSNDQNKRNANVTAAILLTCCTAGLACAVLFAARGWIGAAMKSPEVAPGLLYALPGLAFFSLNKVLLGVLNGCQRMKAYAIAGAARYVAMLGMLVVFVIMRVPSVALPLLFSIAEAVLLLGLAFYLIGLFRPTFAGLTPWFLSHAIFGVKAFGSGALLELNTRIDILMLGYFTDTRIVGIYSLAALLAEGFIQLVSAVRSTVNPMLTRLYCAGKIKELQQLVARGLEIFYPAMAALGILLVIAYPAAVFVFLPGNDFISAWPVFIILMLGAILSSGYMLFSMLLVQAGFPGRYTQMVLLAVLANVVLNWLLIPVWGMYGAALATCISFIFSALLTKIFVTRYLRFPI